MTADKHDDSQAIGIQTMELDVSNIGQRSTGSRSERHKDKKRPPCRGVPDRSDGVERKLKGLLAEVDGRKRSSLVAVGKNVKAFTKDGETTEIPGSDDSISRMRLAEACVRQTASSIPVGFGRFGKGTKNSILNVKQGTQSETALDEGESIESSICSLLDVKKVNSAA